MSGPYNYYLGPIVYDGKDLVPMWKPPAGIAGWIDLSSLPSCAQRAKGDGDTRGVGFFATAGVLGLGYALLGTGDCRSIPSTPAMIAAWKVAAGYQPSGATLAALLFDHLTTGGDPTGQAACPPLQPSSGVKQVILPGGVVAVVPTLQMAMAGHSIILEEQFVWGQHKHTNRVQAMLREHFRGHFEADQTHARKWLGWQLRKYVLPDAEWKQLVPADLVPHLAGPLPPHTTNSDTFNRADQTHLGTASGGFSWTEIAAQNDLSQDTWAIVSNQARVNVSQSNGAVRAEVDQSGNDMDVTVTVVSAGALGSVLSEGGPCCRFQAAAATFYDAILRTDTQDLRWVKCVTGTLTLINNQAITASLPETYEIKISGSTVTCYQAGTPRIGPLTDNSIGSGTRSGMFGYTNGGTAVIFDNFSAADVGAVADTFPAYLQRRQVFEEEYEELTY